MSEISFGTTVSLKQAAQIILATPMNRYLLQGEPGIGKSSLLKTLSQALPDHEVAYIDVPNMDLGDIAMPVIDHETKTTRYYPNSRFKIHLGKPVITMLDEYTKGAEPIKNMLHPMLEVSNPRLGDISLLEQSITFLTGNLSSDAVGDNLKAHSRNRIIPLTVRKPDADEWLEWAINNNIEPLIMAWVRQFPQALQSYMDDPSGTNEYIYNPKRVQTSFVSPRSLERASNIVRVRSQIDSDSLIAAMTGAVGESASRSIQSFVEYQDQLPTWESIIKNPKSAMIPDSMGACAVLVFGAIAKIAKDTMTPFMHYLERFEPEWQACFAINVAKSPTKQSIAFSSQAFADWVQRNEDLL